MLDLSTILKYYKRLEIQEAIVDAAENKEVAVKFGEKGFGKRPDTLNYPSDVIELAKHGASSFHCSEEIWSNPLQISTDMRKKDLDSIRKGWDLVMDIDCPDWLISKITAHLIVKALKDHNISSISAKFSGNKGFHIGVPFRTMPEKIREKNTKDLFPEGPRKIAAYIMDYIGKNYTKVVDNSEVEFGDVNIRIDLNKIIESTGKKKEEVIKKLCDKCGKEIKESSIPQASFLCSRCGHSDNGENYETKECPKCKILMERIQSKKSLCKCGSNNYVMRFDPSSIVEVDTILIASRHLYRMPYSLHEKSSLASIPIDVDKIMNFEKDMAKPENVIPNKILFLDDSKTKLGEAENLLLKSLHFSEVVPGNETGNENKSSFREEIHFEKAVPVELFPPCVQNILKGIEDGKKRSVFVLLNFLTNLGWDYEKIEELLREWNKKNPEPLREVIMIGQLRYHKQNKKKVLPPNCDNMSYYKGFGVCKPDNLCAKIKNPVSYSIRKARFLQRSQKSKKK